MPLHEGRAETATLTRIVEMLKPVTDDENIGVVILVWNQQTQSLAFDSNIPGDFLSAILTHWLTQLPPPTPEFTQFDREQ